MQSSLALLDRNLLADKLMDELVVQPFLACLQVAVGKGADPHQHVKKLERFRDLEAERKLLAIANNLQQEPPKGKEGEERVAKREEVLKKRMMKKEKSYPSQEK